MLLVMTTRPDPRSTPHPRRGWSPLWAKVLAWLALVPAAIALFFGVAFFIQGFGDDALAAIGLLAGPILAMLAAAIAVPAILFLVRGGKARFIIAMVITVALLAIGPLFAG